MKGSHNHEEMFTLCDNDGKADIKTHDDKTPGANDVGGVVLRPHDPNKIFKGK